MVSIVYSPFPNLNSAKKMAKQIISKKLAACVNIIPSTSVYEWKGRVEIDKEHVLVAKTTTKAKAKLVNFIKKYHPYELPAILSWNTSSNREYEKWVMSKVI